MGRGLDGYFDTQWRCAVLKDREGVVSRSFPVALARGKHLFPFRTEKLSPSAPMVLGPKGPGRVGRRRFISRARAVPRAALRRAWRRARSPADARRLYSRSPTALRADLPTSR